MSDSCQILTKSSPTIGVRKHLHVYWDSWCIAYRAYLQLARLAVGPPPAHCSQTDAATKQLRTSVLADVMGMSCLALGVSCNCHVLLTSLSLCDRLKLVLSFFSFFTFHLVFFGFSFGFLGKGMWCRKLLSSLLRTHRRGAMGAYVLRNLSMAGLAIDTWLQSLKQRV